MSLPEAREMTAEEVEAAWFAELLSVLQNEQIPVRERNRLHQRHLTWLILHSRAG